MSEYIIDKETILSLTDLSKSIVPLFAAMTAAYLTYRFSKKDKIRDHLFSYKVKTYSTLAECVVSIKRDVLNKKSKIRVNKESEAKTMHDIWENFIKISNEQVLFLSNQTKHYLFIYLFIYFGRKYLFCF